MRFSANDNSDRWLFRPGILAALCGAALAAPVVLGDAQTNQEVLDATLRPDVRPHAEVMAGVWVPRLGGETRFDSGSGSSQIVLETELDLGDLEAVADIELTLAKTDFAVHLSGFVFSTSSRGTFDARPEGVGPQQLGTLSLSDGDPFRAEFDFSSAAVELQFLQLGMRDPQPSDEPGASMSIVPSLSARWVGIEQSVSSLGASDEAHAEWLGILVGVSMETVWRPDVDQPIMDSVTFGVAAAIGPAVGGDGGYMWQVRTGIHVAITPQFGVEFGYRLVELDVEGDEFDVQAGLQGLFLGGSIRF